VASYLVQEDGTSRLTLEDGTGSLLLEESAETPTPTGGTVFAVTPRRPPVRPVRRFRARAARITVTATAPTLAVNIAAAGVVHISPRASTPSITARLAALPQKFVRKRVRPADLDDRIRKIITYDDE
jgi:hypothetical protein